MEIISNKHHLTLISLVHLFTYLLFPYILNSYFLLSENISDSRLENISKASSLDLDRCLNKPSRCQLKPFPFAAEH